MTSLALNNWILARQHLFWHFRNWLSVLLQMLKIWNYVNLKFGANRMIYTQCWRPHPMYNMNSDCYYQLSEKVVVIINLKWLRELRSRHSSNTKVFQTSIYLFRVINRNTKKRCEICAKLMKTPELLLWYRFGVLIVLFKCF